MTRRFLSSLLIALATFALSGCDDAPKTEMIGGGMDSSVDADLDAATDGANDDGALPTGATIRAFNAAAAESSIDVTEVGVGVIEGLDSVAYADLKSVSLDPRNFVFGIQAGDTLLAQTDLISLALGDDDLLVALGDEVDGDRSVLLFDKDSFGLPQAGKALIRFIQGSSRSGEVDVYKVTNLGIGGIPIIADFQTGASRTQPVTVGGVNVYGFDGDDDGTEPDTYFQIPANLAVGGKYTAVFNYDPNAGDGGAYVLLVTAQSTDIAMVLVGTPDNPFD